MESATNLPWGQSQAAARRARVLRSKERARQPIREQGPDPLHHDGTGWGRRLGWVALVLLGAVATHAAVLGGFFGVSAAFGSHEPPPKDAPIEVVMVSPPEPAPEPVEVEPEAPEAPEAKAPAPKPEPKRRRRPKKVEPPPPDPVDVPPPADTPPPKKKARRIVGLSLGSTVEGGGGPSFGVGNTRMGQTSRTAENADDVEQIRGEAQKPRAASSNRKASRLPIGLGGPKLHKPKYAGVRIPARYPEEYRAQNLEAQITVEVAIGADGRVDKVRVVSGSKYKKFEEAAVAAAKRQRWVPAKRGDEPIPYTVTYSYYLRLED